jgi:uncharacterized protein YceK
MKKIALLIACMLLTGCAAVSTTAKTQDGTNINVIGAKITIPYINKAYSGGVWNDHNSTATLKLGNDLGKYISAPSKK